MIKLVTLGLLVIFLLPASFAEMTIYSNSRDAESDFVVDMISPDPPTNYSLIPTVNSSDFWDGLNTPLDINSLLGIDFGYSILNNIDQIETDNITSVSGNGINVHDDFNVLNSLSVGVGADAGKWQTAHGSIALGVNAVALNHSSAIGMNANASCNSDYIIALVNSEYSNSCSSPDWCNGADITRDGTVAATDLITARDSASISIGTHSKANTLNSYAIGTLSKSTGYFSWAGGYGSEANNYSSTTLGSKVTNNGEYTTAVGYNFTTNDNKQVVLGVDKEIVKVSTSGAVIDGDLNVTGTSYLGSMSFAGGEVDADNITATEGFYGDGSHLFNVNETDPIFTAENTTISRAGNFNCTPEQVIANITINSSGVFGECVIVSNELDNTNIAYQNESVVFVENVSVNGNLTVGEYLTVGEHAEKAMVSISKSSDTDTYGLYLAPILTDTSHYLYGAAYQPYFNGIPTVARSVYGLSFQSNLAKGDNNFKQTLYGGYFQAGLQALPYTSFTADNVLVGIASGGSAQSYGGTITGDNIIIGGLFPNNIPLGGAGKLGISVASGGDSVIASNKRFYFEGAVGSMTAPTVSIGDSYLTYDSTNHNIDFFVDGVREMRLQNSSQNGTDGISMWVNKNISANGYITRTSVYDKSKGDSLNWIKDSSQYLLENMKINHSAMYGYVTYEVPDYDRPEVRIIINNISAWKEIDKLPSDLISKRKLSNESTDFIIMVSNESEIYGIDKSNNPEKYYKYTDIEIEEEEVYYPHMKTEEGDLLDEEVALLKQQMFDMNEKVESLKLENDLIKSELCKKDKNYTWCK